MMVIFVTVPPCIFHVSGFWNKEFEAVVTLIETYLGSKDPSANRGLPHDFANVSSFWFGLIYFSAE